MSVYSQGTYCCPLRLFVDLSTNFLCPCCCWMCYGGCIQFFLFINSKLTFSDSKEEQPWREEMLNNLEIKCLKRLYCNKPPLANFIPHSALRRPHSPSPVITNPPWLGSEPAEAHTPDYKIKSALNPVNTTFSLTNRHSALVPHHHLYGNERTTGARALMRTGGQGGCFLNLLVDLLILWNCFADYWGKLVFS